MPVITNHKRAIEVLIFAAKADNSINKAAANDELEFEFGATNSEAGDEINLIIKIAFESAYIDTESWNKWRNFVIPLDGGGDGYGGQVRDFKRTLNDIIKGSPDHQVVRLEALREKKQDKRVDFDSVRDESVVAIALANGVDVAMTDNLRSSLQKGKKFYADKVKELDVVIAEIDLDIAEWQAQT